MTGMVFRRRVRGRVFDAPKMYHNNLGLNARICRGSALTLAILKPLI